MIGVTATAHPNSNIGAVDFFIEEQSQKLFTKKVSLSAGAFVSDQIRFSYAGVISIKLTVIVGGGDRSVWVEQLPADFDIHLFGITRTQFMASIVHDGRPRLGPKCLLRCVPDDPTVQGPGRLDCGGGGLHFRVCC